MRIYFYFFLFFVIQHLSAQEEIFGCLCNYAKNFDSLATINNGRCKYIKKKLKPIFSQVLDPKLHETSGLIKYNNYWLTHNDDTENWLYGLNKESFEIEKTINLPATKNIDWESITQDSTHIYIGDFGNNKGNRSNLCIYKVDKLNLFDNPTIEKINFSYANQTNFEKANRKNNFDCEAFVVIDSIILLFTKNWINQTSDIYTIPNKSGTHQTSYIASFNAKGLITDACHLPEKQEILLSGYNKKLKPFMIKINYFTGLDFSKANFRRYKIKLPFHQIEAIYSEDGINVWLTNEKFIRKRLGIDVEQKIHGFVLE